jgi:hypothetical protein
VVARTHQTMIWDRQRHVLRLRSMLREYFPAALEAFEGVIGDLAAAFWFGSKNRAVGFPSLSVTVVVCGRGPSTRSVDTLFTLRPPG